MKIECKKHFKYTHSDLWSYLNSSRENSTSTEYLMRGSRLSMRNDNFNYERKWICTEKKKNKKRKRKIPILEPSCAFLNFRSRERKKRKEKKRKEKKNSPLRLERLMEAGEIASRWPAITLSLQGIPLRVSQSLRQIPRIGSHYVNIYRVSH